MNYLVAYFLGVLTTFLVFIIKVIRNFKVITLADLFITLAISTIFPIVTIFYLLASLGKFIDKCGDIVIWKKDKS